MGRIRKKTDPPEVNPERATLLRDLKRRTLKVAIKEEDRKRADHALSLAQTRDSAGASNSTGKLYVCEICDGRSFEGQDSYTEHMKNHPRIEQPEGGQVGKFSFSEIPPIKFRNRRVMMQILSFQTILRTWTETERMTLSSSQALRR